MAVFQERVIFVDIMKKEVRMVKISMTFFSFTLKTVQTPKLCLKQDVKCVLRG